MRRRISAAALPMHRHSLLQIAADGALIALAYFLAFELRFNGTATPRYAPLLAHTIVWVPFGGMAVLVASRVYERRWRYSGQRDFAALLRGVLAVAVLTVLAVAVLRPVVEVQSTPVGRQIVAVNLPNGVAVIFLLLCLVFLGGVRVLASTLHERRPLAALRRPRHGERSVLIVGAGDGGRLVLREILRNRELGLDPVGFLDDDPRKQGLRIDGVRVRGDTTGKLRQVLDEAEPDEVIIAIPSAPGSTRARVVRECRARGVPVRTLPTVFELLRDLGASLSAGGIAQRVREVRVEDVLGRDPIHVELHSAGAYLTGEVVLVTGAGGSIGSELCRQIAQVQPRAIVLVDHAEDNLFAIKSELEEERHVPPGAIRAVLADCKEAERIAEVFAQHRPSVVFHAAAYKHVGLMESNPIEAIRNNTVATRIVATLAGEGGAERFVLVSTDKAVQPATVMGASKALAELSLEAAAARVGRTRYAAVRFGNVLGSSGSVVPIFRRQIARGGPVTVTDERMERYFMTIPEAVQLIIRAGSMLSPDAPPPREDADAGAELFVLEMGEPVKIVDLANAMIELSGLEPGRDVEIELVGKRPGEKLREVLFADHERPMATEAERIVRVARRRVAPDVVEGLLSEVDALLAGGDPVALASSIVALATAPWAPVRAGQSTTTRLPAP
ncbi:MAG: polysaccharide biosynthesis protein [Solirubrobacteraceae bacterium]